MVPDGVRVVSALHTVSAAELGDLDAPLDEDVLVCGDRRRDKRRRRRADRAHPRPALRGLRAAGDGAHHRVAHRRCSSGSTSRYKTHAGIRITGLPGELWREPPVVVLAGGTGGAKLARGMLDVVGADLVVVANTGDDVEIHGAPRLPRPRPRRLLARRPHRRARLGPGRRHASRSWRRCARSGVRGVVQPRRPRPRDRACDRAGRLREGARLTEALAELAARWACGARVLPMCDDAGAHPRARRAGAGRPFQEFMIRERAAGPGRGRRASTALDAARARARGARRASPRARAIVIGPSNPVISIGPILAVPGMREALRAAPRAGRRRVSPIVGGEVLKGPTAAFMAWAGAPS